MPSPPSATGPQLCAIFRQLPGAEFVRNFEKAADMLMDLHEAEAGKKSARL
jgi:hypothetical protein